MKNLKESFKRYIKNKDLIKKEIISIRDSNDGLILRYKNKKIDVLITPEVNNEKKILKKLNKRNIFLVFLNKRKNFDFLVKKWNILKNYKNLTIFFLNQNQEKVWAIKPYFHNKICDDSSLKKGLKTMFETLNG